MPNPKTGTVTFEVARAVREIKAGKVEFRVDKTGIVHAPCGKIRFEEKNLYVRTPSVDRCRPARQTPEQQGQVCQEYLHFFHDEPRHLGGRGLGGDPRLIVFEVVTL